MNWTMTSPQCRRASTAVLVLFVLAAHTHAAAQTITRDPAPRYNTFEGLGWYATAEWDMGALLSRDKALQALLDDMKPDVIRIRLDQDWAAGGTAVKTSDSSLRNTIDFLILADSKGLSKWYGVPWSPPEHFRKFDSSKCEVNNQDNPLLQQYEDDYAVYAANLLDFMISQGAPVPWGVSIQNELGFCPGSWDGCVFSPQQFQRCVKLFRQELDKKGYGPDSGQFVRVFGPEGGSLSGCAGFLGGEGFPDLESDPDLASSLSHIFTHSYGPTKGSGSDPSDQWKASVEEGVGGRQVWQTEMSHLDGDDSQMGTALGMTGDIGKHLAYLGSNGWLFWKAWRSRVAGESDSLWPEEHLTQGGSDTSMPERSKFYYVMRVLMEHTDPGGAIYNFTCSDSSFSDQGTDREDRRVQLFAIENEGKSVVVIANESSATRNVTVQGLEGMGDSLTIYRVSNSENGAGVGTRSIDSSGTVTETIPCTGKSVVILVTNGGSGSTAPTPVPTVTPTPTPRPPTIGAAPSPPVINGLGEAQWDEAEAKFLENNLLGNASGTDLSAEWKGLWDESNLYLFVEVTDESFQNDSTNAWDDDSVEVFLDGDASAGMEYDANDFQLIFRYNDPSVALGTNSASMNTGNIVFAIAPGSSSYALEAAIPWTEVGITPTAWQRLGIDVHVNDDDDGGERDAKKAWHATTDESWRDPSLFGVVLLESLALAGTDLNGWQLVNSQLR